MSATTHPIPFTRENCPEVGFTGLAKTLTNYNWSSVLREILGICRQEQNVNTFSQIVYMRELFHINHIVFTSNFKSFTQNRSIPAYLATVNAKIEDLMYEEVHDLKDCDKEWFQAHILPIMLIVKDDITAIQLV